MKILFTLISLLSLSVFAVESTSFDVNGENYKATKVTTEMTVFKNSKQEIIGMNSFLETVLIRKNKNRPGHASDLLFCRHAYGCATVNPKLCGDLEWR